MNTNTLPAHRVAKMKLIQQGLLVLPTVTPAQKQGAQELAAAVADVVFGAPKAKPTTWVEGGLYLNPETNTVYKAVQNKAKTGWYAMELVFNKNMKKGKFVFAGYGFLNKLSPEMLMDLEAAKAFAQTAFAEKAIGVCCNCGKLLTNPESVAEGIGPVCSGKIKSWY